jgi:hypothetical protein
MISAASPAEPPAVGIPHRRWGKGVWAGVAALLLFLALAWFGARYHWVEEAGTAERDGYVHQAEQLLGGALPRDPYRPLLYPLATAAVAALTRDPFAAARLISNLAAAALAWLAYACGKRLAGPAAEGAAGAGGWAMALVAVNPNLWILGQHVSTDMLFAALGAAALLGGLIYLDTPGLAPALGAGLALGLAAFTRANAVFLVPPLLFAWWAAGRPAPTRPAAAAPAAGGVPAARGGRRLSHLAAAASLSLLVLLPHWALRYRAFGNPFHDENWKNLAWKIHGYPDWSYLDRVPYRGLVELLRDDAAAVWRGGWSELLRFAQAGAAQLLGTWAHVLLFLAGAAWALRWRPRPAAWLLAAGGFFIVATAFTFFTWGRLLLLVLPAAGAFAGTLLGSSSPAAARAADGRRRWRSGCAAAGSAAVLVLAVKTFGFRLPAFIADHPYVEVATLQRLDAVTPASATLAGSSPFLGRYLRHRYVDLPDAFGAEIRDPRLYYAKLGRWLRAEGVAYLVIGQLDLRDRPRTLLGVSPAVPWLRPVAASRGVTVWKVER